MLGRNYVAASKRLFLSKYGYLSDCIKRAYLDKYRYIRDCNCNRDSLRLSMRQISKTSKVDKWIFSDITYYSKSCNINFIDTCYGYRNETGNDCTCTISSTAYSNEYRNRIGGST